MRSGHFCLVTVDGGAACIVRVPRPASLLMKRFSTQRIRCYYLYSTYDRDDNGDIDVGTGGVETPSGRRRDMPPQINRTDAEPQRPRVLLHSEA